MLFYAVFKYVYIKVTLHKYNNNIYIMINIMICHQECPPRMAFHHLLLA